LVRIAAAEASSNALDRLRDEHLLLKAMADRLQARFDDWTETHSRHLFKLVAEEPSLAEANVRLMQQKMGHAQKQGLLRLLQRDTISEDVYAGFTANIDELLRSPSTMDGILAVEPRERPEHPDGMPSSEQSQGSAPVSSEPETAA
jgi:hypothetical protein